jgi:regulator of nucleoside diphosphate kinase
MGHKMQNNTKTRRKPNIRISKSDHARLSALASAVAARNPDASDELFAELERARVVADGWVPADTIQMGSTVTFKPDMGEARTVTLVFPGDADISEGKVSILTPVGTALIGLSAGQSMMWTARDGRRHELSVLAVHQPAPESNRADRHATPPFPAISAGA